MQNSTENSEQGFTLIELLIAMVIALVVITSIASAFISQRKTYNLQEQISEMIQGARAASGMISREVEMAGYDPTGYAPPTIAPGIFGTHSNIFGIPYSATQLIIRADLNGDGETNGAISPDDTNENIIYSYDGGAKQITRDTGGGAQPFAENIESFTFTYWKSDGTQVTTTTDEADIRQIEITITARTAKLDPDYSANSGYREFELKSYITPPNLGL